MKTKDVQYIIKFDVSRDSSLVHVSSSEWSWTSQISQEMTNSWWTDGAIYQPIQSLPHERYKKQDGFLNEAL